MFKKLQAFAFLSMIAFASQAQLKSPDDFLDYKIGSRFTPHWKIVNYFNHVAANASAMMKLQRRETFAACFYFFSRKYFQPGEYPQE
jgi:hypothetical protein